MCVCARVHARVCVLFIRFKSVLCFILVNKGEIIISHIDEFWVEHGRGEYF